MFKSTIVTGPHKALNKKDSRLFWDTALRGLSTEKEVHNVTEAKCMGIQEVSVIFDNDEVVGVRIGKSNVLPSLYTLWKHGDILPRIFVHSAVTHYLLGGAHLMLPGIPRDGSCMSTHFREGEIIAINCIGNPMALAIGRSLFDRDNILAAPVNQKGKAVEILHFFGDHLWQLGSKSIPPGFDFDQITAVNESSVPVVLTETVREEVETSSTLESSEMDSLAWGSLFAVLKNTAEKDLPMNSSALYSKMQLAAKAILNSSASRKRIGVRSINVADCKLDLKMSTWRNFKSFLSEIHEKNLVSIKSVRGDAFITSVNNDHPDVKAFISPNIVASDREEESPQLVKIWYSLNPAWSRLFGPKEGNRKEMIDILSDYLRSVKGASVVMTDHENLRAALKTSAAVMEKKDIMIKFSDALLPMYSMTLEIPPRIRRGIPPKISLTTKRVSGNKLSTTIKGLSQFAINEPDMAAALSRQLSVSVSPVEGGIYCQGDLREKLVKYLTEHIGIPKDCIAVKN